MGPRETVKKKKCYQILATSRIKKRARVQIIRSHVEIEAQKVNIYSHLAPHVTRGNRKMPQDADFKITWGSGKNRVHERRYHFEVFDEDP